MIVSLIILLLLLIVVWIFLFVRKHFLPPGEMFNKQEIIRKKILGEEKINYKKLIRELKSQFFVNNFGATPKSSLCIRNHILISVLYYLVGDCKNSKKINNKVWGLIKYNLAADYAWSEGPNYFLRVEKMMDLYLKFYDNVFLEILKRKVESGLIIILLQIIYCHK